MHFAYANAFSAYGTNGPMGKLFTLGNHMRKIGITCGKKIPLEGPISCGFSPMETISHVRPPFHHPTTPYGALLWGSIYLTSILTRGLTDAKSCDRRLLEVKASVTRTEAERFDRFGRCRGRFRTS